MTSPSRVLIIGSGPIVIGQAAEFVGAEACSRRQSHLAALPAAWQLDCVSNAAGFATGKEAKALSDHRTPSDLATP